MIATVYRRWESIVRKATAKSIPKASPRPIGPVTSQARRRSPKSLIALAARADQLPLQALGLPRRDRPLRPCLVELDPAFAR